MMSKNPNERIKVPAIKAHPWFSNLRISFVEFDRNSQLSQSNLITDSMILEGEDPFDDFMNKKLLGNSRDSDDRSRSETRFSDFDEGLRTAEESSANGKTVRPNGISFKKNRVTDGGLDLEIIPEERAVDTNSDSYSGNNKKKRINGETYLTVSDGINSEEDEVLSMMNNPQDNRLKKSFPVEIEQMRYIPVYFSKKIKSLEMLNEELKTDLEEKGSLLELEKVRTKRLEQEKNESQEKALKIEEEKQAAIRVKDEEIKDLKEELERLRKTSFMNESTLTFTTNGKHNRLLDDNTGIENQGNTQFAKENNIFDSI